MILVVKVILIGDARVDLPDNPHRNIKRRAIDEGILMKQLLINKTHDSLFTSNRPHQLRG